jgi:hypothetical protein
MENENTEKQTNQAGQSAQAMQQPLPNASAVLVLGILSIVTCWCYGFIGLVLGIIGLVLSGKPLKLYKENPDLYTESSFKNVKAGRICSIIGLSISGLLILIGLFAILGIIGGGLALLPFLENANFPIDMIITSLPF